MINGLSVHTSDVGASVQYLLIDTLYFHKEQKVWLERDPPAELLEGDPDQLVALCNSLAFKNQYTNGCLSFTLAETAMIAATPGMREAMIEDLREFAYAGVKNDDSKQLWVVQHTHTGRLELNYVIPRVNLESGKYFNPFPPNYDGKRGKGNNQAFLEQNDAFVDYMCSKYGLQNPRDPNVAREIKIDKFDPEIVDKKMINEKVGELVANGHITSRKDVVSFLEKAGGQITRLGKDYLSVKFDDKPKAIRLRGAYYSDQSFTEIRAGLEAARAKFSDPDAAEKFEAKYREVQNFRSAEVEKRHELRGLAAERANDFDRKSASELKSYAIELNDLKESLPDYDHHRGRINDAIASDPSLSSGDGPPGIENGLSDCSSGADPILTGDPGADQLIRAFSKMQKKLANEELQRSKTKWHIDPKHEQQIKDLSDSLCKLFTGLATGKNLMTGRPGAMQPADIAMARREIQAQRQALQRELKAVAQVVKHKERTEPLKAILDKPKEPVGFEAKRSPAVSAGSAEIPTSTAQIGDLLGLGRDGKKLKPKPRDESPTYD